MEVPLRERAAFINDSMLKSQTITRSMVSILASFDYRLSALEAAMRPTQIRTDALRKAHENIDWTLKEAQDIIHQLDLCRQAETRILRGPHQDLETYLQAIDELKDIVKFFCNPKHFKTQNAALIRANNMLSGAISKLDDEFRNLLALNSEPHHLPDSLSPSGRTNSSSSTECKPLTLIPPHVIPLLHSLADQMVQAGHQQQVVTTYRETRSLILEISLTKLGVEPHTKDEVHKMPWEVLESKIGNWIQYLRIVFKLVFPGEKKAADQIFHDIESIRTLCFAEAATNSVATMFSFGDAVARSKRSPEKLFVLLDMYEIMRELLPEIESIFEGEPCAGMRESAAGLTKRLAQTALETFDDFEVAVEKDSTKSVVLDGTVHPLTSYVINYVKFLLDYQSTLKQLFQDCGCRDADSRLGSVTTRVIQALLDNLDAKSKLYKDAALTQLFLMNNVHYIVRSVCRSNAKELLGNDWVQIHRRVVQQHANQYKRVGWLKILQYVGSCGGKLSKSAIRERFKNFNIELEEHHDRQSQWSVPDSELREALRLAVAEVLLPAYSSFLQRFGLSIEGGKYPNKIIKYTPEDLEHMLSELFEVKIAVEQKMYI